MTLDLKVTECKSYNDLLELIDSQEQTFEIIGSHKSYDKEELIKRLIAVEQKWMPVIVITRAHGLRKRVMQLLGHSPESIMWYCEDDV